MLLLLPRLRVPIRTYVPASFNLQSSMSYSRRMRAPDAGRVLRPSILRQKVWLVLLYVRHGPNSDGTASRAYKQAMSTLATLTALPPMQSEEPSQHANTYPLSSFLPTIQGQGPVASALRILVKLRNHSWLPSVVTDFLGRELTNGRKKDEEHKGKAVKVIDLLQHAADLGHTDALYTLGQVSLVSSLFIWSNTAGKAWCNGRAGEISLRKCECSEIIHIRSRALGRLQVAGKGTGGCASGLGTR